MKKIATALLLITLFGCYHHEAETTGFEGKLMPSFKLHLVDSITQLNTQSIPVGQPIIMCYIGTYCPYSRAEVQDIIDNIAGLKNTRIYFLTSEPFKVTKGFYRYYGLSKYSNITMGVDSLGTFGKYFQAKGVPYIAIYTSEKKLLKAYTGKVEASLLKSITEN